MSKFEDYLKLSCKDKKINKLRELNIGLVDKETENIKIIKEIKEKYKVTTDILEILNNSNTKLKKKYKNDIQFDLLLNESNLLNNISINKKKRESIKLECFKLNDELCKLKNEIEKKLSKEQL